MNRNRRLTLAVLVTVVLLAAASAVTWRSVAAQPGDGPGTVLAAPGNPAREAQPVATPVPGGPGFDMQSPFAFRPVWPTTEWGYALTELYNPGAEANEFVASLSLPNGATITKLVVYYVDGCASNDLRVDLGRCAMPMYEWVCDVMATVSTSGSEGGYDYEEDSTVQDAVIDQQSYYYIADAVFGGGCDSSLRLVSVRVDYAFGTSLPLVPKQ